MVHAKGFSCGVSVGVWVLSGVAVLRAGVLNTAACLPFDGPATLWEVAELTEDRFLEFEGGCKGLLNGVDCPGDGRGASRD